MNIFDSDNFDEVLTAVLKGENPPMVLVEYEPRQETLPEAA